MSQQLSRKELRRRKQLQLDIADQTGWPMKEEKLKQGYKADEQKNRVDLLPVPALREIAKVLTFGCKKYHDYNWSKGILFHRVYRAAKDHLDSWWNRQDPDAETGTSHLANAGCCILFLLTYMVFYSVYKRFDDRPDYVSMGKEK